MKNRFVILMLLMSMGVLSIMSCKKFLDEKSDKKLSTPDTLEDLQAVLDGASRMNVAATVVLNATDELYVKAAVWKAIPKQIDRESYIWYVNTQDEQDWNALYLTTYSANTVLDYLPKIDTKNDTGSSEELKGSALFFRAHAFYQLAQIFAGQYDESTAGQDRGIVLRLNSDFSLPSTWSTLKETYERILADLNEAAELLPEVSLYKTRPNKCAAYGLLSRTYLIMGNFGKALEYAEKCLTINRYLIDFNQVDGSIQNPFPLFNDEVLLYCNTSFSIAAMPTRAIVDSNLMRSYGEDDLRKQFYFASNASGDPYFRGSYNGSNTKIFTGIATDEIYLIKAEALARLGQTKMAMEALDVLLQNRHLKESYKPLTAETAKEALELILSERKKELVYRGIRFSDIRRLNKEGHGLTLKRKLEDQEYILSPNDPKYIWLIPDNVVEQTGLALNR